MKTNIILFLIIGLSIGLAIALSARSHGGVANTIKSIQEESNPSQKQTQLEKQKNFPKFQEIVKPGGYVNTNDTVTIGQYVGKKVVLLDIMTYSCINCQRTFPYLVDWYKKYEDKGLVIIGIHTPEFAFEHNKDNVAKAMKKFGITFPVVLDNEYGTWNAYGNRYWPRKYLIDVDGYIIYDHIGEGGDDETELAIQKALLLLQHFSAPFQMQIRGCANQ